MSNIKVFLDTSKSMTSDAKMLIQRNLIQSLSLLPKVDDEFSDITYSFEKNESGVWDIKRDERYLFISDGFTKNIDKLLKNKNVALVLIGEDSDLSILKKNDNAFPPYSVINALLYLKECSL